MTYSGSKKFEELKRNNRSRFSSVKATATLHQHHRLFSSPTSTQHNNKHLVLSQSCCTLSFGGLAEGKSTCYKLNSSAEDEWKYQADSLHGTVQPSGMQAHYNQHRSVHCVSRVQPLIWMAIWGSGFQLYIWKIICPIPALSVVTWFKADGLRWEQQWSCVCVLHVCVCVRDRPLNRNSAGYWWV